MLEHLFEAELVYHADMEPLTVEGEGELIGSGDGTVAGPAIAGELVWTLFERPGRLACAMNPVAVIARPMRAPAFASRRGGLRGERTRRVQPGL